MDYKNLSDCLAQITACKFVDANGHPLENNVGFAALVQEARATGAATAYALKLLPGGRNMSYDRDDREVTRILLNYGELRRFKTLLFDTAIGRTPCDQT